MRSAATSTLPWDTAGRSPRAPLVVVAAFCSLLMAAPAAKADHNSIVEYTVPTSNSGLSDIVAGPDGNLWFIERSVNKVGRIVPSTGKIKEYSLPAGFFPHGELTVGPGGKLWISLTGGSYDVGRFDTKTQAIDGLITAGPTPHWLTLGADGNVWSTWENSAVGRFTPTGGFTMWATLSGDAQAGGITAGADGNLWFTERFVDQVARVTPIGVITEFALPRTCGDMPGNQKRPWEIAPGPDGNVWFTEAVAWRCSATDYELYAGRVTPGGDVDEFVIATPPASFVEKPAAIATEVDGSLWLTTLDSHDENGNILPNGWLRRLLSSGAPSELISTPTAYVDPYDLVLGPDGNLWFTEPEQCAGCGGNIDKIGRLHTAEPNTGYVLSMDAAFAPKTRTIKLGETVKWVFQGPTMHGVKDKSKLALFDSGAHSFVEYFSWTFTVAGTYAYVDTQPTGLAGSVQVPVDAPNTGVVGTPFTVTWASEPIPAGLKAEVEVKTPGSSTWTTWQADTTASSAQYTPGAAGTYQFRARLEKGAKAVKFSPAEKVVVS
jgi:streptogramin lyase/plastocyanin